MRFAYTQDCTAQTANDATSVTYLTLSIGADDAEARRETIDELVQRDGGDARWRSNGPAGRSYALLELPDGADLDAIRAASGASAYDGAVIALAVFPAVAEALPHLLAALSGSGRPAGILACRECEGGIVVEWDPQVSSVRLVLDAIDVELRRFNSGRTAELLSPLPPAVVAAIASQGLQAPEIEPERILELRIENV